MRHFTRWSLGSVALSGLVLLSGCGSNNDEPVPVPLQTGRLVGKLIEQVPYECGSEKGRTGRLGQFSHRAGDACKFSVGTMVFAVTAAKLQKGYVTAYDLTETPTEAWTLMAILESISHWRPGKNLMVVDNNLLGRIPSVPLRDGDLAVAAALAPFKGTVKPVSVSSARILLAQTVNTDNSLVIPLDSLVAQGKATLDALQIATDSGMPFLAVGSAALVKTTDNRVNLRFYDAAGNALPLASFSNSPRWLPWDQPAPAPWYWYWFTGIDVTNLSNPGPSAGSDVGTMQGPNIMAYSWEVERKDSDNVGSAFQRAVLNPDEAVSPNSPISILAAGAHPSANENTVYPQQLNFGFSQSLVVNAQSGGSFTCTDLVFGQSTTKTSLKAIFNFLYDLGDTVLQAAELVGTDGSEIQADYEFLGSVKNAVKAGLNLGNQNWWIVAISAATPSYRVSINKNPAVMMACKDNNNKYIPVVINSTADDHTFDVYVAFTGQRLLNIGGYPLPTQ